MQLRAILLLGIACIVTAPAAGATHDGGCVPEEAPPSTYTQVILPDGTIYYLEERDSPLGNVPGSGFLLGGGTWLWEEFNGLAGLQRGREPSTTCVPDRPPLPCVIADFSPGFSLEEACGHGWDVLVQ